MSILNDGRNEIRFNNSDAKCLLENWVEEREVQSLYPDERGLDNKAEHYRRGHKGLFTQNIDAKPDNLTIVRETYTPPQLLSIRKKGKRRELKELMYFEQAAKEVEYTEPPLEVEEYKSVMMKDYNKDDFVSVKPAPTAVHDYKTEQPVTFWTEHKDKITGVSQVKTGDTAFRKNDAFSKPIEEYWNEPEPYEKEDYPKM